MLTTATKGMRRYLWVGGTPGRLKMGLVEEVANIGDVISMNNGP